MRYKNETKISISNRNDARAVLPSQHNNCYSSILGTTYISIHTHTQDSIRGAACLYYIVIVINKRVQ